MGNCPSCPAPKVCPQITPANKDSCIPYFPEPTPVNAETCAPYFPAPTPVNAQTCAPFFPPPVNAQTCAPYFPPPINAQNCAPYFPPAVTPANAQSCAPYFPAPIVCLAPNSTTCSPFFPPPTVITLANAASLQYDGSNALLNSKIKNPALVNALGRLRDHIFTLGWAASTNASGGINEMITQMIDGLNKLDNDPDAQDVVCSRTFGAKSGTLSKRCDNNGLCTMVDSSGHPVNEYDYYSNGGLLIPSPSPNQFSSLGIPASSVIIKDIYEIENIIQSYGCDGNKRWSSVTPKKILNNIRDLLDNQNAWQNTWQKDFDYTIGHLFSVFPELPPTTSEPRPPSWKYAGCWKDACDGPRTIPEKVGDLTLTQCKAAADAKGYNVIGMQYGKPGQLPLPECWIGKNVDYKTAGASDTCGVNGNGEGVGDGCTNSVYLLGTQPAVPMNVSVGVKSTPIAPIAVNAPGVTSVPIAPIAVNAPGVTSVPIAPIAVNAPGVTSVPISKSVTDPIKRVNFCEGDGPNIKVSCPIGQSLKVNRFLYGRPDTNVCTGIADGLCPGKDYTSIMQSFVSGNSISFANGVNAMLGYEDPCPGIYKQIQMEYECLETVQLKFTPDNKASQLIHISVGYDKVFGIGTNKVIYYRDAKADINTISTSGWTPHYQSAAELIELSAMQDSVMYALSTPLINPGDNHSIWSCQNCPGTWTQFDGGVVIMTTNGKMVFGINSGDWLWQSPATITQSWASLGGVPPGAKKLSANKSNLYCLFRDGTVSVQELNDNLAIGSFNGFKKLEGVVDVIDISAKAGVLVCLHKGGVFSTFPPKAPLISNVPNLVGFDMNANGDLWARDSENYLYYMYAK